MIPKLRNWQNLGGKQGIFVIVCGICRGVDKMLTTKYLALRTTQILHKNKAWPKDSELAFSPYLCWCCRDTWSQTFPRSQSAGRTWGLGTRWRSCQSSRSTRWRLAASSLQRTWLCKSKGCWTKRITDAHQVLLANILTFLEIIHRKPLFQPSDFLEPTDLELLWRGKTKIMKKGRSEVS